MLGPKQPPDSPSKGSSRENVQKRNTLVSINSGQNVGFLLPGASLNLPKKVN